MTYTDEEIKEWVRLMLMPVFAEEPGGGVFKKNATIIRELMEERDQARAALEKAICVLEKDDSLIATIARQVCKKGLGE